MTNKGFDFTEIYPNILVYKNVFEDPGKMYEILKNSSEKRKTNFLMSGLNGLSLVNILIIQQANRLAEIGVMKI